MRRLCGHFQSLPDCCLHLQWAKPPYFKAGLSPWWSPATSCSVAPSFVLWVMFLQAYAQLLIFKECIGVQLLLKISFCSNFSESDHRIEASQQSLAGSRQALLTGTGLKLQSSYWKDPGRLQENIVPAEPAGFLKPNSSWNCFYGKIFSQERRHRKCTCSDLMVWSSAALLEIKVVSNLCNS